MISNNHFQEDENVKCLNDFFEKFDMSTFLFSHLFSEWKKREINQRVDQIWLWNINLDRCNIMPMFCHAKVKKKFFLVIMNILSDLTCLF